MRSCGSGRWREALEQQRRALPDSAGAEPSDGLMHAHGRGVPVHLDHDALDTAQILGSGLILEPHAIADVQHRQRLGGADGFEQIEAGVDRVGDRVQVRVELALSDLVQQQPLRLGRARRSISVGRCGG